MIAPGDRIDVLLRAPVHSGAVIAAIAEDPQRRTVFVRHGLPGERGTARVTAVRAGGRIVFADLVGIDTASPDRVRPACPASGPGGCGGCDLQHVAMPAQRRWKAQVLADSLRRIARLDPARVPWDQQVHAVAGDQDGLRWRTRGRFTAAAGQLAMQGYRSSQTVVIEDCPITCRTAIRAAQEAAAASATGEISVVASSAGEVLAGPTASLRRRLVHELVADRELQVAATGFWQVHPGAAATLVAEVGEGLELRPTDTMLDLYGGVGLFAAALGGAAAAVHLVEGDRRAAGLAAGNLAHLEQAAVHTGDVAAWLSGYHGPADAVVLDPPRSGAGAAVIGHLDRLLPRSVVYVACDPAALARDLATAGGLGWQVQRLAAYDLFPMTHHFECVAVLRKAGAEQR